MSIKTYVGIIGGGPVGKTLSILLEKMKIPSLVIERNDMDQIHPQAHYISNRTMEIFRQCSNLDKKILKKTAPIKNWRKFIYCTSLSEEPIGVRDHFIDYKTDDCHYDNGYLSPSKCTHLPQNRLCQILSNKAKNNIYYGMECINYENNNNKIILNIKPTLQSINKTLVNESINKTLVECNYVVATDGAHSIFRDLSKMKMSGLKCLQNLVNVYFTSKYLGEILSKNPGMLYFIYNSHVIAVMVAHDIDIGEFVLQIPYFPPYETVKSDFSESHCISLINSIAGKEIHDVAIHSIKGWKMAAEVNDSYISDNIIFAGDSAHKLPPAGGLGLNLGIGDVNALAWRLARIKFGADKRILEDYARERRLIALYHSRVAIDNFRRSLNIPRAMGLNWELACGLTSNIEQIVKTVSPTVSSSETVSRIKLKTSWIFNLMKPLITGGLSIGRQQINIYQNIPCVWDTIKKKIQTCLEDPWKNLSLVYPGADLAFAYPIGSSDHLVVTNVLLNYFAQPAFCRCRDVFFFRHLVHLSNMLQKDGLVTEFLTFRFGCLMMKIG
eukprot:GHVL01040258.1.p1 GENE.GHVL01040258.1~~GHVL01040258.1.p1  ORF type:complete len:554 (+),score=97.21 GHVL01040258.1:85-1746(+)